MTLRIPRSLALLGLVLALAALTAIPARPARAQAEPTTTMHPWAISANLTGSAPVVTITEYEVEFYPNSPPVISTWSRIDISSSCVQMGNGTITYQNGFATFNNAYLRCTLPPLIVDTFDCDGTAPPYFYFAAEVRLKNATLSNPLLAASDGSFVFSTPSLGAQAKTRLDLWGGSTLQTNTWPRSANWNEVLIGQGGSVLETVGNTPGLGLLTFLAPTWQTFFGGLGGANVGHWANWPTGTRTWNPGMSVPPIPMPSPDFIDIGHANGTIFDGKIAYVEGDPVGCTVQ